MEVNDTVFSSDFHNPLLGSARVIWEGCWGWVYLHELGMILWSRPSLHLDEEGDDDVGRDYEHTWAHSCLPEFFPEGLLTFAKDSPIVFPHILCTGGLIFLFFDGIFNKGFDMLQFFDTFLWVHSTFCSLSFVEFRTFLVFALTLMRYFEAFLLLIYSYCSLLSEATLNLKGRILMFLLELLTFFLITSFFFFPLSHNLILNALQSLNRLFFGCLALSKLFFFQSHYQRF